MEQKEKVTIECETCFFGVTLQVSPKTTILGLLDRAKEAHWRDTISHTLKIKYEINTKTDPFEVPE